MTAPLQRTLIRISPLLVIACASGGGPPASPPVAQEFELLRCERVSPASAEAEVDARGDTLRVRGHRFVLPPRAVNGRVPFVVRERATGHVGVDIRPDGTRFQQPAQLTLSYARCRNLPSDFMPAVVEVNHGGTRIVGEPLPGTVDTEARTVTVDIQHLSGYLIGGNRAE